MRPTLKLGLWLFIGGLSALIGTIWITAFLDATLLEGYREAIQLTRWIVGTVSVVITFYGVIILDKLSKTD